MEFIVANNSDHFLEKLNNYFDIKQFQILHSIHEIHK